MSLNQSIVEDAALELLRYLLWLGPHTAPDQPGAEETKTDASA